MWDSYEFIQVKTSLSLSLQLIHDCGPNDMQETHLVRQHVSSSSYIACILLLI
jgi:hypothetical protein